ncbi:hypothetical protein DV736_g3123, partial [Chaetothyriales sp. CBS 134916]
MATSARGRYDPVFQPSSGPSYVDPALKTPTITNPFEIESQHSNTLGIQPSGWYGALMVIKDAFLSLLPVLFIILAFRALAVNGKPLSSSGQVVVQAAKFGPTAFPIIFAAVVGRLMRAYALWKAERGTRLGVLEQLVGSQNLLASIERVFVLRNYTLLGWSILILWALSPVGSQSALRVIGTTEFSSSGSQRVYYFNTTNDGLHTSAFDGADDIYTNGPPMEAVYRAALLAPENVKASAVDIWNNPKVPFLEQVPFYGEGSNPWLEVPDVINTSYSSLTGIIVANLPSGHNSNFSIQTSYFHLDCTDPRFFNIDYSANITANPDQYYSGFLDWLGNIYFTPNKTNNVFGFTANQSSTGAFEFSSFMIDTNWNYLKGNPLQAPINLIYASQGASAPDIAAFNCTLGTTRVEANLLCSGSTGRDCRVSRMRRSLVDLTPNTTTPFNSGDPIYLENFIRWFTFAAGAMHELVISPTDLYLSGSNDPYKPLLASSFGADSPSYNGISGHSFALRFARLLNTAWQVSMATASIAQPPSNNLTALAENVVGYNTANTTANTMLFTEVYAADPVWLALTLVISFILLACGIAGMAFKYLARAPDILGYVSTMTRDNPYFHVGAAEVRAEGEDAAGAGSGWDEAANGSNRGSGSLLLQRRTNRQAAGRKEARNGDLLDGLERAKLLRNARVQIADVKPWTETGHVALRSLR